jgi:hypothetical protein
VITPEQVCPFLDRQDMRCAKRMTMLNLEQAFRLCAGNYESCIYYYEIRLECPRVVRELVVAGPV